MIIPGNTSTLIRSELITEHCPNCKHNTIQINVFQKYAHMFGIPLFPTGKTGMSQCNFCKQVFKLQEMPLSIRLSYDNLKARSKTPFLTFAGGAVIVLLLLCVKIADMQKPQKLAEMISLPRVKDVYEIKQKNDTYTLLKINNIAHDTLYFSAYKYQSDQEDGLSGLADSGYTARTYMYLKSTLFSMNKNGEIVDIKRK